jgi:DNA-binding transcriptional MerR regulator
MNHGESGMKSSAMRTDAAMSIGKLAKATGATIDTIRFYEKAGLLPKPARTASGYRKYSRDDELRLAFVARARALGFSLDEIGEILKLRDAPAGGVARVRAVAKKKLELVEARLAELAKLRVALASLVSACPGSGEAEHCPILNAFRGVDTHG